MTTVFHFVVTTISIVFYSSLVFHSLVPNSVYQMLSTTHMYIYPFYSDKEAQFHLNSCMSSPVCLSPDHQFISSLPL